MKKDDKTGGKRASITMTADKRRSEESIQEMLLVAEEFAEEDKPLKEAVEAKTKNYNLYHKSLELAFDCTFKQFVECNEVSSFRMYQYTILK